LKIMCTSLTGKESPHFMQSDTDGTSRFLFSLIIMNA